MNKRRRVGGVMAWEPHDELRATKPGFPNRIMGMNIIILKVNLRYLNI